MESLVLCHHVRFSMCYLFNCPPLLFVHQCTSSWCFSMAGIKSLLKSAWAGRSVLGLFFHCFSWSCCILPEAAFQNSKLLPESGVQVQWIGESPAGASSPTASVFRIFTYQKTANTCNRITNQGFSAWPKIRRCITLDGYSQHLICRSSTSVCFQPLNCLTNVTETPLCTRL